MKNFYCKLFLFLTILVFAALPLFAQLSVPEIFSNGAVLQRDIPIPVWGKAAKNAAVSVTLRGITKNTTADSSGRWRVSFDPFTAGGPFPMSIASGSQTININSVYIGDVWFASGQSNMELQVNSADSASQTIASANDPKIREFKVSKGFSNTPSDELPVSSWNGASTTTVGQFSAVAYYFARELRKYYDIPIGIINTSYGGARIEAYMSDDMLGFDEKDSILAHGESERQPTLIYNKMVYPVIGYGIKGFLWYQGESNADNMFDAVNYKNYFITFINEYRKMWGLGDIPFLWVQLPNYGTVYDTPQFWDAWPQLRAGQSSALVLPNTGEAVTIDVGAEDIHPKNKIPVGYRLALLARKIAYGENIVYNSPRYSNNVLRDDGKVEVNFDFTGSGLTAKGVTDSTIRGFAIAASDGNLKWADAKLEGNKVIVWNDEISEPYLIRYAWEYNPANVNLYNKEGLPAAPFLANVNPGFKIASFSAARTSVEYGQSTSLSWLVFNASKVTLDGVEVDTSATITISPLNSTTYTLIAVNRDDSTDIDSASVTVTVLDPTNINRAKNHPAAASTFEACCGDSLVASLAVDDDFTTRWSSAWSSGQGGANPDPNLDDNPDDEWISVDMGDAIDINRMIIYWEAAYGKKYNIEVSYDGYNWRKVYTEENSNGGQDDIVFNPTVAGRFIRVHGVQRATQFGYSIYEIAAYGLLAAQKPPTVKVGTTLGNVVNAGTAVTLTADAGDTDGLVTKVSFYVDSVLVSTDTEAPYTAEWTAGNNDSYSAFAVVTDDDSITVQSDPITIYVDNGTAAKFEAEKASYTGQGLKTNTANASGGAFMDMRDAWTLTWNNVQVAQKGDYLLIVTYRLLYESPKTQYLVVNGDTLEAVEFTAPTTTLWYKKGILVPLKAGVNTVAFHGFWNWMGFDYIAVPGATVAVSVEEEKDVLPSSYSLSQNYPNPFNPSTLIRYSIPQAEHVTLKVYDILGNEVQTLINNEQSAGSYQVHFDASALASGVYFYTLKAGSYTQNRKMLLLK